MIEDAIVSTFDQEISSVKLILGVIDRWVGVLVTRQFSTQTVVVGYFLR